MRQFAKKILLALALCVLSASQAFSMGKKDDAHPQHLTGSVVALSRSIAELWLLAGGTVSGTTDDALDLPGLGGAASIGTLTAPSLETILSLSPTLVLLTADIPAHKKLVTVLGELGVPCRVIDIKGFADYDTVMRSLTTLTGRDDLYHQNVTLVAEQIQRITATVPPGFGGTFLFVRASPTKTKVLKEHFALEIMRSLNLAPVASDDGPLDGMNIEAVVRANPTYVFVVVQGDEARGRDAFRAAFEEQPAWQSLDAVRDGRVIFLPKDLFNYKPNARWAQAYQFLYDALLAGRQ